MTLGKKVQRLVTKYWKLFRCKLRLGTIFQGGIIKYKIRHSFVFILDGFLDKDKDKVALTQNSTDHMSVTIRAVTYL